MGGVRLGLRFIGGVGGVRLKLRFIGGWVGGCLPTSKERPRGGQMDPP